MPNRYQLVHSGDRLELHDSQDPHAGAVYVDFLQGKAWHRLNYGGGKGQAIAKAIGLHKYRTPHVLELTAGLGRESFVLASLGCRLTMLERNPTVYALLADGLKRAACASHAPDVQAIVARMRLFHAEAGQWLAQAGASEECDIPDIIYLDPMFPERKKSALVQKDMRFFHELVGPDEDADQLITPARQLARYRVVVKRPCKAPPLSEHPVAFSLTGKTTRYDVYLGLGQTAPQPDEHQ